MSKVFKMSLSSLTPLILLLALALTAAPPACAENGLDLAPRVFASREAALDASGLAAAERVVLRPLAVFGNLVLYRFSEPFDGGETARFEAWVQGGGAARTWVAVAGRLVAAPGEGVQNVPARPDGDLTRVTAASGWCAPAGGFDDTLSHWSCCTGYAVSGSTVCYNASDYGTTWTSCSHVCGTAPVGGCIPSGGVDDILSSTSCCSGTSVSGSGRCLNPAHWGGSWASCIQTCG